MNRSLNTFYWLLKREFWEHRGGFLWAPIITAGVVIIIQILGLITAATIGNQGNNHFAGLATASPGQLAQLGGAMDMSSMIPALIVGLVLFFVLYGYCMKNLSNDRRDRSILFWKSLPLSDTATVISKAFSAVIVATVIAFVVSTIAGFVMVLIWAAAGSFSGGNFVQLLGLAHPGEVMLGIIGGAPVFWVWMLPSVGWLMMCSAFSAGKTMRWAVALPLVVGALFTWVGLMQSWTSAVVWGWEHVFGRVLLSILPGSTAFLGNRASLQFAMANSNPARGLGQFSELIGPSIAQQYSLVLTPDFLWGALAGLIMLAIAIWLRRWRTEL